MLNGTPRPDVLTRARELRDGGSSYEAIARVLQAEQYPTLRGGKWVARGALALLKAPHPHSAFLVPCAECGQMTSSKYGICHRTPCVAAYLRLSTEPQRKRHPTKPCESCGQPTTSVLGICGRLTCRNARRRRERTAQKGAPSVYALWFPSPFILKVGFSKNTTVSIIAASARIRARRRGWDTQGSRCIWQQPGDTRTEAWMQATLAFRWQSGYRETSGRICEWFQVADLTAEEIAGVLDSIYEMVPADLVGGVPLEAEAVS